MAWTIGVSGPAGGGKTTLVKALAASIDQVETVHFDDHPVDLPPSALDWLQAGAYFNEWGCQGLVDQLSALSRPGAIVVVEAPLGRAHRLSGGLIDFLVFIDTPLEVALARWVRRRLTEGGQPDEIAAHLDLYESVLRPVYLEQRRQVLPDADLVVDGLGPPAEWVARVLLASSDHLLTKR
jgi:uridine kinase